MGINESAAQKRSEFRYQWVVINNSICILQGSEIRSSGAGGVGILEGGEGEGEGEMEKGQERIFLSEPLC